MKDLSELLSRFADTPILFDRERLAPDVLEALPFLVEAMKGMDALYRRQIGVEVVELCARIDREEGWDTPLGRAVRHFNGPYDKLDGNRVFVEGIAAARPGKDLYPHDLTEAELDTFVAEHPDQREALLSPTSVVVREGAGLAAVPYHEHFRAELEPVAEALRAAAARVAHPGLKTFLENRARALLGELPYRDSDAEWVRLTDAPLEVVIGPFEVYEDELKGVKALYEGMLFAIDFEAGARLAEIERSLSELAALVPTPAGSKPAMGGMAPMVVADEIIASGDGYAGILAAAFNLPNDPWVRGEVGWKQVMIKNVMQAKFDTCTRRIAERTLAADQRSALSFDAFFFFILLHEVSHGLGPAYRADGRSTNEACGKHYSALEEAKADVGSLVLMLEKNGTCGIPALTPDQIGASYLAGLYRSSRFGLHEAHGKANVVEYTFFRREGVFVEAPGTDQLRVVPEKLPAAAEALLGKLCTLQADGSPEAIEAFLSDLGVPPPELEKAIEGLADLPTDIRPQYQV